MTMVMERMIKKLNTNTLLRRKLDCTPNYTFGAPLEQVLQRDGTDIPVVVAEIIKFLERNRGLYAEGIFRVNGNLRLVETLRHAMNSHQDKVSSSQLIEKIDESDRIVDVYSVASLLKLYLRELPGGLISHNFTSLFFEAVSTNLHNISPTFLTCLGRIVYRLPATRYALLQHLCCFLHKVLQHRDVNKMSAEALGIVFGPNVFRVDCELENIQDQGAVNRVMSLLIEYAPQLFRATAPSHARVIRPSVELENSMTASRRSTGDEEDSENCDRQAHPNSIQTASCVAYQASAIPGQTSSYSDTSRGDESTRKTLPCNEFSIGLAAAIRSCIDDHLFRGWLGASVDHFVDNDNPLSNRSTLESFPPVSITKRSESRGIAKSGRGVVQSVENGLQDTEIAPKAVGDSIAQLTHRLRQLKTRLRDCEHRFEADCGHKPSITEKRTNTEINRLMQELSELRVAMRRTRSVAQPLSASTIQDNPVQCYEEAKEDSEDELGCQPSCGGVHDNITVKPDGYLSASLLPQLSSPRQLMTTACVTSSGVRLGLSDPDSVTGNSVTNEVNPSSRPPVSIVPSTSFSSVPKVDNEPERDPILSLQQTYNLLVSRLSEKRSLASRPESLSAMTARQIEAEKLALQKALLYFENLYGRPKGRDERFMMRPLYDRYRNVKRLLAAAHHNSSTGVIHSSCKSNVCHDPLPLCDTVDVESSDAAAGGHSTVDLSILNTAFNGDEDEPVGTGETTLAEHLSQNVQTDKQSHHPLSTKYSTSGGDSTDVVWSVHGSMVRRIYQRPSHPSRGDNTTTGSVGQSSHGRAVTCEHGDVVRRAKSSVNTADRWKPRTGNVHETLLHNNNQPDEYSANTVFLRWNCHESQKGESGYTRATNSGSSDNSSRSDTSYYDGVEVASQGSSPLSPVDGFQRSEQKNTTSLTFSHMASDSNPFPVRKNGTAPTTIFPDSTRSSVDRRNRRVLPILSVGMHSEKSSVPSNARQVDSSQREPSTLTILDIRNELQSVQESKRRLQKTLKDFEHDFVRTNGRRMERADRVCMRAEYNRYKRLKDRLNQLEAQLDTRVD